MPFRTRWSLLYSATSSCYTYCPRHYSPTSRCTPFRSVPRKPGLILLHGYQYGRLFRFKVVVSILFILVLVENFTLSVLAMAVDHGRCEVCISRLSMHVVNVVWFVGCLPLLSLSTSGLGFLPDTTSLFFLLANLPVFDLVLPNQSHWGVAKNSFIFAELANPLIFWLLRVQPILPRSLLATLPSLDLQVPRGTASVLSFRINGLWCFSSYTAV